MKNNYETEYHLEKHSNLYKDKEYYYIRAKVAMNDYFKNYSYERVLDFGCGLGNNIYLLDYAKGYDISKFALDFCRGKGLKATDDLKKIRNNHFDIVFSSEVLEHLERPLDALKIMRRKLADDGRLIIVVPIDRLKRLKLNDKNQHLYCWNYQTMTNLLIRAGFKPIEFKILRRTGFKKFLPFSRISFKLYLFLTKFLATLSSSRHLKVVAIKMRGK